MMVLYIRLVAAHWRALTGWVVAVLIGASVVIVWENPGRWEARARLAVEGPPDILPIVKARIASQDLARKLGVKTVTVSPGREDVAVLDIIGTGPDGAAAIRAVNAVLDAIVSDNEQAHRATGA